VTLKKIRNTLGGGGRGRGGIAPFLSGSHVNVTAVAMDGCFNEVHGGLVGFQLPPQSETPVKELLPWPRISNVWCAAATHTRFSTIRGRFG
jgi:hypothetical protein